MLFPPAAHALNVGVVSEVVLVLRTGKPPSLTLTFALPAALRLGAELLMMSIAAVRPEQILTAQALHELGRRS